MIKTLCKKKYSLNIFFFDGIIEELGFALIVPEYLISQLIFYVAVN
jgi:hypothetical protein